jgi:hypothetical protein
VIVELRQYTLRSGQWDVLAELFDRALAEGQEAVGMTVLGWFRDLDDPDRFVWLRAFPDMSQRAQALAAFYGGPVWTQHRKAANATMIDSENVLLLRPPRREEGFSLDPGGRLVASIHQFSEPVTAGDVERLERKLGPVRATLVTEEGPNDFPSLPIREGEHVVVRFSERADPGADEVLRLEA